MTEQIIKNSTIRNLREAISMNPKALNHIQKACGTLKFGYGMNDYLIVRLDSGDWDTNTDVFYFVLDEFDTDKRYGTWECGFSALVPLFETGYAFPPEVAAYAKSATDEVRSRDPMDEIRRLFGDGAGLPGGMTVLEVTPEGIRPVGGGQLPEFLRNDGDGDGDGGFAAFLQSLMEDDGDDEDDDGDNPLSWLQ